MTKIKDINAALVLFQDAANMQAEATESGNYKMANKCYNDIVKAVTYLRKESCLDKLLDLLKHPSIGVRLWAASYLLFTNEKEGVKALKDITNSSGIHSLTAETTLSEWRKGNLKL